MSDATRQPPPKKEVALALLEGSSMFVHLDPRRPDVQVPKWFAGQPQLILQVGLNMAIPIPDLNVDDTGITCTLSFNRTPFWCQIPWSAVYALVGEDGRGGVWAEDVPPEIQIQKKGRPTKPSASRKGRPSLVAAPTQASGNESDKPVDHPTEAETDPGENAASPAAQQAPAEEAAATLPRQEIVTGPAAPKKGKREIPPYLRVIK